ncbi:HipA domain-containing protein [Pseudoramibacter sp. HA2172]|uniref:HipA domain-containing protein n=1 Tax=Pseudoramibacter faecis TaxID=3108534 RepID=UPI002E76FE81|nr:HipA domain-containing protein [Pseudoramibacter sp. HA2172]
MEYIDFTNLKQRKKTYAGANGNKISVIYEGEQYMLKFPAYARRNKDMSYTNGCFSEYLGCRIYESIGVLVQKTLLGTFTVRGKEKVVVACKDFTEPGVTLQDFASLKNRMIDSERQGYGTELSDILQTIEEQQLVDHDSLLERFWDMFIVDALIGNWDRHNGNWGFLYDDRSDEMTLAPVYDCGSCLYPQADETIMEHVLTDRAQLNKRIYDIPLSAINVDGKKIRYFDFISSLQYEGCNEALRRILPRIDMEKIGAIIEQTPFISDLQKRFYMTMLTERKARILDFSLAALEKNAKA